MSPGAGAGVLSAPADGTAGAAGAVGAVGASGTAGARVAAGAVVVADATVRTDDGARLVVTVHAPAGGARERTVVLAHGWAAGRTVWEGAARVLAAGGHRVVSFDQRGHGSSTPGGEPIGVERLGRDLEAVIERLVPAGEAVVVAGHSGGGFAALSLAARWFAADPRAAGGRLHALVLAASAAHGQDTPASEVRMMGSALFGRALGVPWLGRRLLAQTLGPKVALGAQEANRRLFAATDRGVRAACFASTRGMDLRAALAAVTVPAVVIAGEADKVVDPKDGRALAGALAHGRFESLPAAGHMLPLEAPHRLAAVIAELAGR
ncbi:alpha/beta fold hydrolase [Kitasatospora sp. NPDC058170]|uniref:alpha/beta fold hydrolase n=1 Tax=Kitasatospora sp. NPDC058170 TaxID=3346364 RepID=UPI0036DF0585